MQNLYIYSIIFFLSSLFHTLSGFGFPLIATPLLFLATTPKAAIVLTLFPTLFMNIMSILMIKKGFEVLKKYYILGFFIIIGSFIGTNVLILHQSNVYKLILAIIIIFYLFKDHLKLDFSHFINTHKTLSLVIFGLISGFVGGLVNVMVVVIAIFILELKLDKNKSIVVMNFSFLSSKITQITTFSVAGAISKNELLISLLAVCICIVSILIARKIKDKINDKIFRQILKITLYVFAILLILQYFLQS